MVYQVQAMDSKGLSHDMLMMPSRREMADKPVSRPLMEEKIYVAVGRDVESKSTLIWALQNTGGKEFCIFHVHQLVQISSASSKFRYEHELRVRRKERDKAHKVLDKYLLISQQMGVRAEKLFIEMDTIENGIVQLISQQRVMKLVMGAASDGNYSMRMRDLKSRKAIFVRQNAPPTCHIWFTCNGYLICKREAVRDNFYLEYAPSQQSVERNVSQAPNTSSGQASLRNGQSDAPLGQSETNMRTGRTSSFPDRSIDDAVYDQIRIALAEVHKSKQAAVLETNRRQKAEKYAVDAITRAKKLESAYSEEIKQRKEAEIAMAKANEELQMTASFFHNRVAESDKRASRLQHGYNLAVSAVQRFMKEREKLQAERDRALRQLEETKGNRAEPSAPQLPISFTGFQEAPQYFFCPISKEIMEDPQVAADGFTYEAKAIRQWLETGHDTSPMTNTKLPHTGLVPNLALRSSIHEWLQLG